MANSTITKKTLHYVKYCYNCNSNLPLQDKNL